MSLTDKSYLQDARAWAMRVLRLRYLAIDATAAEAARLHRQADMAVALSEDAYRRARGRS